MIEAHGLREIAAELPRLGLKGAKAIDPVIAEGAQFLADQWRRNAEQTSGEHGKHYPKSIDTERVVSTDIVFEVGPNPSKKQGRMSFEEGSVNQPAHLDGAKALDKVAPLIHKSVEIALGRLGF